MEKAILQSEIKKQDGGYSFIMSDETIDRDGEVIEVDGWDLKQFKKNPVLLWGHRHDIPAIGVVTSVVKQDGQLVAKGVRFATEGVYELADTVRGLVDDGILKAVSVGFIPEERKYPADDDEKGEKKKKPKCRTTKAQLYELSIVNVGSNPNALSILKGAEEKAVKLEEVSYGEEWDEDEKPYPNEHACRLIEPVDGAPTRRKNGAQEHEGKKYDVIYQKQKDGKWAQQAYRYPKGTWKAAQAKSHCSAHDGKFEAASESSIDDSETVTKKMDLLLLKVEELEQMIKQSKPKRKYDELFAGDPKEGRTTHAEKEGISALQPRGEDKIEYLEDEDGRDKNELPVE